MFWGVSRGVRFAHRHARKHLVGVGQGHSKSTGAMSRGLVFTNHGSFEHSKTTTVHGTPKCANPQTLSENHAISFFTEFSSTLDDLNMTPRSMAMGKTRPLCPPYKSRTYRGGGANLVKIGGGKCCEKNVTQWGPVESRAGVGEVKKLARRANEACLWCYCACGCGARQRFLPATNVTLEIWSTFRYSI